MPKPRAATRLAIAAILLTGLAACTETPGQPLPQPDPTTPTHSTQPRTTSTTPAATHALDNLDPCQLLTQAETTQLGAGPGERHDTSLRSSCQWTMKGQGVFSITIRPEQGLKDIVTDNGTISDYPVGDRHGRKLEGNGGGGCMIIIEIAQSARVDVSGTTRADTAKACRVANNVVNLIEPRLPKGE
ncbi:DUF3558 family protein [Actinokineospora iranica]|nr:DUF3558 family protein [Actinokineospora iranica]